MGLDEGWALAGVDPDVVAGVLATAERLRERGAEVVPVTMPGSRAMVEDWPHLCGAAAARAHAATYPARRSEYGAAITGLIELGRPVPAAELAAIAARRAAFRRDLRAVLAGVDVLLCPAMAVRTPLRTELDDYDEELVQALRRFTVPFNMSGSPTITFPAGTDRDGLPVAAQLVGDHLGEAQLVRVADALQELPH